MRRLRPVVPDRAARHRRRRRRRDRLDHPGQRRRGAAPACCSRPGSTPGSDLLDAQTDDRRLRAPLLARATASIEIDAATRDKVLRRLRRTTWRPCRTSTRLARSPTADQGRRAAQGRRHRLGRAAVVQPAAGGAHPGPGERRRHLHEAGADAGGVPAHHRRRSAATSSTRATAPSSRSGPCRRTPTRGWASPSWTAPASSSPRSPRTPPTWTGRDVNEPEELAGGLADLGRAMARMHSVGRRRVQPRPGATSPPRRRSSRRSTPTRTGFVDLPGRLRARVRRPGPRRPPDLRRPVPQRPDPGPVDGPLGQAQAHRDLLGVSYGVT